MRSPPNWTDRSSISWSADRPRMPYRLTAWAGPKHPLQSKQSAVARAKTSSTAFTPPPPSSCLITTALPIAPRFTPAKAAAAAAASVFDALENSTPPRPAEPVMATKQLELVLAELSAGCDNKFSQRFEILVNLQSSDSSASSTSCCFLAPRNAQASPTNWSMNKVRPGPLLSVKIRR